MVRVITMKLSLLQLADQPHRISELDIRELEQAIMDAHRLQGTIEGLGKTLRLERDRRLAGVSR